MLPCGDKSVGKLYVLFVNSHLLMVPGLEFHSSLFSELRLVQNSKSSMALKTISHGSFNVMIALFVRIDTSLINMCDLLAMLN